MKSAPTFYYVILCNGAPEAVTTIWSLALQRQKEFNSAAVRAEIITCVPAQKEFDFSEALDFDEDTKETTMEDFEFPISEASCI